MNAPCRTAVDHQVDVLNAVVVFIEIDQIRSGRVTLLEVSDEVGIDFNAWHQTHTDHQHHHPKHHQWPTKAVGKPWYSRGNASHNTGVDTVSSAVGKGRNKTQNS